MKKAIIVIFISILISLIICIIRNNIFDISIAVENYRSEMIKFVSEISNYTKSINKDFIVISQNGEDILEFNKDKSLEDLYIKSIDGIAKENMNYGYTEDDEETSSEIVNNFKKNLDYFKNKDKTILITDYCYSEENIKNSLEKNKQNGYLTYIAKERDLNIISNEIYLENSNDIFKLSDAKNFLYVINPENYSDKEDFIYDISQTNYDIVIMDLFFNSKYETYSKEDIEKLKVKKNGGKRIVICYMSIGEAEDYRYYWEDILKDNPTWLKEENDRWGGNYVVEFWNKDWKNIIYGNEDSYSKKILDAGFDGVFLDLVDIYYYFEGIYN